MRKKSFLSDLRWKTVPWKYRAKSQKDTLLDILVNIPTLLEECDLLRSYEEMPSKLVSRQQLLIGKCWLCQKRLIHWYENLILYKDLKPIDKAESAAVENMDLGSVHLLTLYWSTCAILYGIWHEALGRKTKCPRRAYVVFYCRKIVRAISIFLDPAVGTFRAYLASFPLYVVMMHFHVWDPEERETEKTLLSDLFNRPEGIGMAKFLTSVELEAAKHSLKPDFRPQPNEDQGL
jgi:hypothetical protein